MERCVTGTGGQSSKAISAAAAKGQLPMESAMRD